MVTCKRKSRVQGHTNLTLKAQVTDNVSNSNSVTMLFDLTPKSGQDKVGQRLKARPRPLQPNRPQSYKNTGWAGVGGYQLFCLQEPLLVVNSPTVYFEKFLSTISQTYMTVP